MKRFFNEDNNTIFKLKKIRLRFILGIITTLFIIITAFSYYLYNHYLGNQSDIITITEDNAEYKQRPQDPESTIIANSSSLIYERIKKGDISENHVRILPEPEKPLVISSQDQDSIDLILENLEFYETDDTNSPEENTQDSPNVIMPNLIHTSNSQEEELFATDLNIIRAEPKNDDTPIILDEKTSQKGYKLQLSLATTEAEATKMWQNFQKKYGTILAGAKLVTQKVKNKNDQIFFLVMAGTYSSLAEAKLVCNKLIAKKQNCIIY